MRVLELAVFGFNLIPLPDAFNEIFRPLKRDPVIQHGRFFADGICLEASSLFVAAVPLLAELALVGIEIV